MMVMWAKVSEPPLELIGKWIGAPLAGHSTVKCSVCNSAFLDNSGKWKFCPECGSMMGFKDSVPSAPRITEKQKNFIEDMNEFCTEKFAITENTTRKEASEYISRNIDEYRLQMEVMSKMFGY